MSSFGLGSVENKDWVGIWIRVHSPLDGNVKLLKKIKSTGNKRLFEFVERIVITDIREDGKVGLEIWCQSLIDILRGKFRHNVFYLLVEPDLKWSCEGDLGRGYAVE